MAILIILHSGLTLGIRCQKNGTMTARCRSPEKAAVPSGKKTETCRITRGKAQLKQYSNWILAAFAVLFSLYVSEYVLGRYIVKSLADHYLPANSVQTHVSPDFTTTYSYNNYAIRDDDYALGKRYDVMLLGDSFLFGQGVDIDRTLASRLEHDAGLAVLNASEIVTEPPSYFRKLRILDAIGFTAKHYVVGIFFGNDFSRIENRNIDHILNYHYDADALEYDLLSFLGLERLRYLVYAAYRNYRNDSHVHKFERKKAFRKDWIEWYTGNNKERTALIYNVRFVKRTEAEYLSLTQINEVSVRKTAIIINAMDDAIPNDAQLHVLLIPDRHYVKGDLSKKYESFRRLFISRLKSDIDVVDLHEVMTEAMYFPNDGHWNALGHRAVAGYLLGRLGAGKPDVAVSR